MADETLWQTKLYARLHDPAESALALLRNPARDETGTSRALHRRLGLDAIPESGHLAPDGGDALHTILSKGGLPVDMYRRIQRADAWASAADRPQWPMGEGHGAGQTVADWAQAPWNEQPTLIHPLNGKEFDVRALADVNIHGVLHWARAHFERLVLGEGEAVNWRRTLLALWRFGPELRDAGSLGKVWPLLPADTRVPDHSIWDHLDLVSAFAGAFAADPNDDAALLALSIGPVQSFIAAARSTSDLWAGSHLLARLLWEAAKVVCERLGPDAILFPRLRGIPQVDVWLRDECGLPPQWFAECDWSSREDGRQSAVFRGASEPLRGGGSRKHRRRNLPGDRSPGTGLVEVVRRHCRRSTLGSSVASRAARSPGRDGVRLPADGRAARWLSRGALGGSAVLADPAARGRPAE